MKKTINKMNMSLEKFNSRFEQKKESVTLKINCRLLDSSHSDWHEMVPHCGFDLHFSNNE